MIRHAAADGRAATIYRRLIDAVGDHADEVGPAREVAAHWPFVGSQYRGLVIVGQALDGWDADDTPARWRVAQMRDPAGREQLLRGAQAWSTARDEPILEPMTYGKRRRAPFWGLSKRVAPLLEPDLGGAWHSRYAWWNVYPLGWDRPSGSPTGALKRLQTPFVGELFWAIIEELSAHRIVLVSGKDWWPEVRVLLGLESLVPATKPVIAAGRVRGVTVAATYHPGAHLRGMTRDDFAAAVTRAVTDAEGSNA